MIVFDLNCTSGHQFEVWFRSTNDFDVQMKRREVECPICGDVNLKKAPMAPNIGAKSNQTNDAGTQSEQSHVGEEKIQNDDDMGEFVDQYSVGLSSLPPELQTELETVLVKVQQHVEDNCDYVGENFAEEARRIHYGETESRGIYGEATEVESEELLEEGIDLVALPLVRKPGPTDA